MCYITIGLPPALPHDLFMCYSSHQRPSVSGIQELARRGPLHTTDDDVVLLVRNPTPPPDVPSSVERTACLLKDEPVFISVLLLMRSWIMQACHSTASFNLGTRRTLRMLEKGFLVDRQGRMRPVVASPLLEVPSAKNLTADCVTAKNLHASL